jgi:hypothetical protein
VTVVGHLSDNLWMVLCHFTDHKERGSRIVFRQHVS